MLPSLGGYSFVFVFFSFLPFLPSLPCHAKPSQAKPRHSVQCRQSAAKSQNKTVPCRTWRHSTIFTLLLSAAVLLHFSLRSSESLAPPAVAANASAAANAVAAAAALLHTPSCFRVSVVLPQSLTCTSVSLQTVTSAIPTRPIRGTCSAQSPVSGGSNACVCV